MDAGASDAATDAAVNGDAGGPDGGWTDAGTDAGEPIDSLVPQYWAAACAWYVQCQDFSDQQFCESLAPVIESDTSFNQLGELVAAVKAGTVRYDPSTLNSCLAALGTLPCPTSLDGFFDNAACSDLFQGTVSHGDSCTVDQECPSGNYCQQTTSETCDGLCETLGLNCTNSFQCPAGWACGQGQSCVTVTAPGNSGQPCNEDGACAAGLFCNVNDQMTCEALAQLGDTCTPLLPSCANGLLCVPNAALTSGTCMTPVGEGGHCTTLFQCGGAASPLICDPSSQLCVQRPSSGNCPGGNILGCNLLTSYCDTSQPNSPTCMPYIMLGATCDPGMMYACSTFGPVCQQTGSGTGPWACSNTEGPNCTP